MIYLATASGPTVRDAISDGRLGQMITPNAGNRLVPGATYAIDNGCFSDAWSVDRWLDTLERHRPPHAIAHRGGDPRCLFAVVPDVVGDGPGTEALWRRWWSAPMRLGFRAAFVLQNKARYIPFGPSAVFIGGDTDWKLGPEARHAVHVAKRRGLWVHMGRVNTLRRLRYAAEIGCDSVDGTLLAFGPDVHLPRLLRWLNPDQQSLLGVA